MRCRVGDVLDSAHDPPAAAAAAAGNSGGGGGGDSQTPPRSFSVLSFVSVSGCEVE